VNYRLQKLKTRFFLVLHGLGPQLDVPLRFREFESSFPMTAEMFQHSNDVIHTPQPFAFHDFLFSVPMVTHRGFEDATVRAVVPAFSYRDAVNSRKLQSR
jgi:hypothetical protein